MVATLTLTLTRSDVAALLEPRTLLTRIREGFVAALSAANPPQRARSALPEPQSSAVVVFPGLLPAIPAYTVKVHAKFPQQQPALRGLVQLFDLHTGALLAVMDSGYLTAVRTAAAAALASDTLARPGAGHLALIGAGAQNALQLELLAQLRPLHTLSVYDSVPLKTGPFVRRLAGQTAAKLVACDSLAEALDGADIVVAATWARDPFLYPDMLGVGAHVTTLGADEPGKAEVSADLITSSRFFCDSRALALSGGAVGNVGLAEGAITGELGAVLSGQQAGRLGDELTVYGGVGVAWMDLVAAWSVYQAALGHGLGTRIDFFA